MRNIAIAKDNRRARESMVKLINEALGCLCIRPDKKPESAIGKDSTAIKTYAIGTTIHMTEPKDVKYVNRLKEEFPSIIVILTKTSDFEHIVNALRVGVCDHLIKHGAAEIVEAMSDAKQESAPMISVDARKVVKTYRTSESDGSLLSGREQEILEQLSKGSANKEIAGQMHISLSTVRTHLRNIYKKLHVRCRTEAVVRFGHDKLDSAATEFQNQPFRRLQQIGNKGMVLR